MASALHKYIQVQEQPAIRQTFWQQDKIYCTYFTNIYALHANANIPE